MTTTEKGDTMRPTPNAQRPTPNLHACPNLGERIHIALAVHDSSGTYSQHAGVTMTSIFENTSSPVTIHLLHDNTLTQENREKFIRTAQKYSQEIEFIDMSKYSEYLTAELQKMSKRLTIGTLYRAFIPQLLPNIDKVIYFDCDVIVNLDISELWNIDLENKSIAAVFDIINNMSPLSVYGLEKKICGIDIKKYINTGVLLINSEKIRKNGNFFEQVKNWLLHYHDFAPSFDQDAINSILADDIKFIDSKFNLWDLSKDVSNSIIHMFNGKPWEGFTGREHEKIYWRMYLKSAWGEDNTINNLIDKLAQMNISSAHYIHPNGGKCVKRLINSLKIRLPSILYILTVPYMFIKYFIVQIKYKFSR